MADTVLVASVTGIVVSGVVGPLVTSWASWRAARRQFNRDQAAHRRDELRALLDEAAELLGEGPTRLREVWEADRAHVDPPDDARAWSGRVFLLGQRLRLRLPENHAVSLSYEQVRTRLVEAAQVQGGTAEETHQDAVARFEVDRGTFLDQARAALEAPIPETEVTG